MLTRDEILNRLSDLKPVLKKEYGLVTIGLFGSYARNEQSEESDIDILIELRSPQYSLLAGVLIFLEQQFPVKIDLVRRRAKMPEKFLHRIEREIVYV